MNFKTLRVYRSFDVNDLKNHLLICGDLNAQCSKCQEMGLKWDDSICSSCRTPFYFIAFRNVKDNMPKILKILETDPQRMIVDFEDYKRVTGQSKAEEFFK